MRRVLPWRWSDGLTPRPAGRLDGSDQAASCGSSPGPASMITRQGRSASTVSSVRPKSEAPVRLGGSVHHDRPGLDLARLVHDAAPGLARPHLLPVPGHAPAAEHSCRVDRRLRALAPASGIAASIGALAGTEIVTSTWMPRRRRAASLVAVATASRRVAPVLEGHQHGLVLHLVLDDRLRHHDLRGLREAETLTAAVDHVDGDADQPARCAPGDQRLKFEDGDHDERGARAEAAEQGRTAAAPGRGRGPCRGPGRGAPCPGASCAARSPRGARW